MSMIAVITSRQGDGEIVKPREGCDVSLTSPTDAICSESTTGLVGYRPRRDLFHRPKIVQAMAIGYGNFGIQIAPVKGSFRLLDIHPCVHNPFALIAERNGGP